ncbi:MAG: hypothetical protein ABJH45_13780 [Paracoccaceae bacterium]
MRNTLNDLLAMDLLAQQFNCGLNPQLKRAIEAGLRFPVKAAVPLPTKEQTNGTLPENVTRLSNATQGSLRSFRDGACLGG